MINITELFIKNKYKVLIILIIVFLIFYGLWVIVSSGYDRQNKTILLIKKIIPTKISRKVRDTVFIIPNLKERNRLLELVLRKHDQNLNGEIFSEKVIISSKNKNEYLLKEFFIPFPRLDLRLGWASSKNTLRKNYLEIFEDKIILISGDGETIYFNKKNIFKKKLNQIKIPNNIKEILDKNMYEPMGIRDLFIQDKKVYISLYFKTLEGNSMNIYHANLDFNKLEFKTLFESKEFWKDYSIRTGGRIEKYKNNKILVSLGDCGVKNSPQNLKTLLGKIISIDKTSGKHEIVSIGHRNPQGLLYIDNQDIIVNAEHGPKGGDEININFQQSDKLPNYGWDISSYGTEYGGKDPYKKSHVNHGFIEPFKYYTPSIGISEIFYLPSFNGEKHFFVSSLRAGSIYIVKIDDKITKILDEDRIFFPEHRIRDLKYDEENKVFFLVFDSIPSFGVLDLNIK